MKNLYLSAALVCTMVLSACEGSSSPTQPLLPEAPPPGASISAVYTFEMSGESGLPPEQVEVRLDGAVRFAGAVGGPWDEPNVVELGPLAVGRHRIEVRVMRQAGSPTQYQVHGLVELVWREGTHTLVSRQQVAAWQESVTLATGAAWGGEFDYVEGGAGSWDY